MPAVLADKAIDAVVLATPHSQHAEEIVAAAQSRQARVRGKAVHADARRAPKPPIAACEEAGITLHVGFNRRYAPAYVDIGEADRRRRDRRRCAISRGNFSGPPSYQTEPGNWRSNQVESPGGSMTARGVHVIDSMVNIAGLVAKRLRHQRSGWSTPSTSTTPPPVCCALPAAPPACSATLHATSAVLPHPCLRLARLRWKCADETELNRFATRRQFERLPFRSRRQGTR